MTKDIRLGARLRQLPPAAAVNPAESRKGVQSVDVVFSILRALEEAGTALSLGDLARRAGQQPSKVHHYLVSLIRNGMVAQNSNGRYDFGPYALQMGLSALGRLDIVERASEAISAFRDETGEAAFVAVWGNRGPTIIRYVEGTHPVTVEARAGLVLPLLTSATGQVFLTWLPESVWRPLVATELTMTVEVDIAATRGDVQKWGVGITRGGLLPRVAAISAPVFRHDVTLACSLTTLGLLGEINVNTDGETAKRLRACAERLSRTLGFHGKYPVLGAATNT